MVAGPNTNPVSTVLVDESFATEGDNFVELVRRPTSLKYLAGLADRWKKDPRPWAREQIFRYLALPMDCTGHHPLVKRLFKHAEATADHELMAAFMVAFDRLVRRQRRMRYRYDYQTRQSWQEEELFSPRDQILASVFPRNAINLQTGQRFVVSGNSKVPKGGRLFSYKTRRYLQRRAWRYFRRLGFMRPAEYCGAITNAFVLYRDEDVAKGENILDNWSLMHAAFGQSAVLRFSRIRVDVAESASLSGLIAAPRFEKLWKETASASVLLDLVTRAESRLVRVWAIQLLKQGHGASLQNISVEQFLALLNHADQEVQQFGASLLDTLAGVDSWPVTTWLQLLETRSVTALATICEAMSRRVRPERLSVQQCVSLTCARATPVARLGLTWLQGRSLTDSQDRKSLIRLADVQCDAIGAEAAEFGLAILGMPESYKTENVSPFFDSLNEQVRRGAWAWLIPGSTGYEDPTLWSRLLESPYDDVRIRLVEELSKRTRDAAVPAALRRQELSSVWAMVLLGVHRGGRAKLTALRQISQAIADHPDRAERLIPVLTVAIRSVRAPEARAGLAAILSAVSARPELEDILSEYLPELRLSPVGGAT